MGKLQSLIGMALWYVELHAGNMTVKLNFDVTIDADLDTVWAAFDDPDNLGRWQTNFHSYTHKSGEPRQPGCAAELKFNENGKIVVLTETITERREKSFLAAAYESTHGTNIIVNQFAAISANETRWTSWCKFSFRGLMRVMSLFIGGVIRKRTEADMQRFKLLVETNEAGSV
jgi:uncharacterized membrane protein